MAARPPVPSPDPRLVRWLLRINLPVVVLLAAAIFALVDQLSRRHAVRLHWGGGPAAPLAAKTRRVLEAVADDIRIVALTRPAHPAHRRLVALLQEYAAGAEGVSVELVDPDRDLARAEEVARRYEPARAEGVVFEIGGRHRFVPAADLIEAGPPDAATGTAPRVFRGEQLFTSAILALTQATRPAVCFVRGHGEHAPDDFDRHAGYSRIAARLRDENLELEPLDLAATRAVPNHCALLVVAGPAREFAPFEVALVRDYLNRKGRLLLLLDARVRTGLEPLLLEWGAVLGDDIVVDESRTLDGRELFFTGDPGHPVSAPLRDLTGILYLPRSIRTAPRAGGGDRPAPVALAACSPLGWAEFDPDEVSARFDPQVDIPGPVPVAVAIERGPVPGVHVQIRPTRLVVVGDSDFASNGGLAGANADLFLNAVNWLLDREDLLALAPRSLDGIQLVMDARQSRRLFWILVVGLPALFAGPGLWVVWRRRR